MDQAGNQLHDLIPGQAYIVTAVFLVAQALSIVIFATVRCTGQCVGASAGSVFLPEKRGFFLVGMGLLEKGINAPFVNTQISALAPELLTPDEYEMYQVYIATRGNKPLLFGGGSPDMGNSEDLSGVEFINGTRPGNPGLVDLAKRQVGNVGGYPYWSWYGFNSRVEWCACFVSWCYNQAGKSEPRFAGCQSQGVPWFQSHGQWGGRGYANIAPGDAIFFDWDLDGSADHVGIVIGTDGSRVYTVEGNSGDACKIKSYDLNYQCIKGYGLMNWN